MKKHVLSPDQLYCLASPARNEVYLAFRGRRPLSVREAAEAVGRSPEAVLYHVRALTAAALLRIAGSRSTKRKPETLYEAPHARLQLPDTRKNPEVAALNRKAVLAGMRQTARGYVRAAEAAEKEPGHGIVRHVLRGVFRLRPKDARQVLDAIEAAFELARKLDSPEGDRILGSSFFFSDVSPRSDRGPAR